MRSSSQPPPRKRQSNNNYSLAVDLISSIDNESMVDIILVANDGGEIAASRFVLGARSPVLQKMLFQEKQTMHELRVSYSTDVVRALVHYCRTNELLTEVGNAKIPATARVLVQLYDCANEFELKGLQELICTTLGALTKTHPHLACAVYDETGAYGEAMHKPKSIALQAIRLDPNAALLKKNEFGNQEPGVSSLGSATVETIISDPRMNAEEITMFKAIALWANSPEVGDGTDFFAHLQERRHYAKQMVSKCISLSNIAPSDLLGTVSESNLVEGADISNALVNLALRVEREGFAVSKRRGQLTADSPRKLAPMVATRIKSSTAESMDNSLVTAATDDMSTVSVSTTEAVRVIESSQKKKTRRGATSVTPEKSQKSARLPRLPTAADPRRDRSSRTTIGSTITKAVGRCLIDKVDSMCVHPGGADESVADNDEPATGKVNWES